VNLDIQTYARKNVEIVIFDFAGQNPASICHSMLTNKNCLCIIVVDLNIYSTGDKGISYRNLVQRYMDKAQAVAPGATFLIVGSRLDMVGLTLATEKLEDIIAKFTLREELIKANLPERGPSRPILLRNLLVVSNVGLPFWNRWCCCAAVESLHEAMLVHFVREIHSIVRGNGMNLLLSYRMYLKALREEAETKNPVSQDLSLEEAMEIARTFGLDHHALEDLHDIGLLYWRYNDERLEGRVFVNLRQLMDFAKQFVRHDLDFVEQGRPRLEWMLRKSKDPYVFGRYQAIMNELHSAGTIDEKTFLSVFDEWKDLDDTDSIENLIFLFEKMLLVVRLENSKKFFLPSQLELQNQEPHIVIPDTQNQVIARVKWMLSLCASQTSLIQELYAVLHAVDSSAKISFRSMTQAYGEEVLVVGTVPVNVLLLVEEEEVDVFLKLAVFGCCEEKIMFGIV
jgi:hypothetical protein